VMGVGLAPILFIETSSNRFDLLKAVATELHGTASILTGAIGLFILWSHRRDRTITMVATKPSPLDSWVASIFASAVLVGLAVHVLIACLTFTLSLYWGVPYQIGFLYMAADRFVESLIGLAVLTALSAACHPILAVVALAFFNQATFMYLGTVVAGAIKAGRQSMLLPLSKALLTALYYIAPTFGPFDDKTLVVERTLRVAAVDWRYLAGSAAYAALACLCGYLMTLVVLRRRRLT